jgi:hypothetical protein
MTTATPTTAVVQNLKIGRLDATVKVLGANAATIALTSLAKSDETIGTSPVPTVDIHSLKWSVASSADKITITRNSVVLYYLIGSGEMILNNSNDPLDNTSDIVVDCGLTGTVILELRKKEGYIPPFTNVGV